MKKVFLMLAFAGLVGSMSASVKTTGDGDKDKAKKECKKDGKCCKDKAAEGKSCSADKKACYKKDCKAACCKDKKAAETKVTETK
jgi:hypothetical protein